MSPREKLAHAESSLATRKALFEHERALLSRKRRSWGLALAIAVAVPYAAGFALAWGRGERSGMPASAAAITEWTSSLDDAGALHAACREETITYQNAWTACREEQTTLGVACHCAENEPECGCTP